MRTVLRMGIAYLWGLWFLRATLGVAAFVVSAFLYKLLVKWLSLKIVEDAVIGWINGQLSEAFGIRSPTAASVVAVISEWAPAALGAIMLLGIFVAGYGLRGLRFKTTQRASGLPTPTSQAVAPIGLGGQLTNSARRPVRSLADIHARDYVTPDPEKTARRNAVINDIRILIAQCAQEKVDDNTFKNRILAFAPFYEIRPHLSEKYRGEFDRARTYYVRRDGSPLPVLEDKLLDEIDELEKRWNL